MKTRDTIRFDPTLRRWRIFHMDGGPWKDDYETAAEAVNRVCDAIAHIWLKYHEYWIPALNQVRERER